jgi:hypothetical protein
MTGSSKEAWDEVGERFAVFGRALAARYKQLEQERGATTEEDKRRLDEAVSTITRQLDQEFTSVGDTIRDPRAKDDLKLAARSVGDALSVTFQEVGHEGPRVGARKAWERESTSSPSAPVIGLPVARELKRAMAGEVLVLERHGAIGRSRPRANGGFRACSTAERHLLALVDRRARAPEAATGLVSMHQTGICCSRAPRKRQPRAGCEPSARWRGDRMARPGGSAGAVPRPDARAKPFHARGLRSVRRCRAMERRLVGSAFDPTDAEVRAIRRTRRVPGRETAADEAPGW